MNKHNKHNEILVSSFRGLSGIALSSEEYRKMLLDKGVHTTIEAIIDLPGQTAITKTEGELAISNITKTEKDIPDEEKIPE